MSSWGGWNGTNPSTGQSLDPAVCLNLLTGATFNITTSRYITAAGLVIAAYDLFLLAGAEVRLVWRAKSKISIRMLYYFNRYIPPLFLLVANYQLAPFRPALSTSFCRGWIPLALCFQVICGMCSSYILLLRVVALYGDRRGLNLVIYTLFFFSYGICIVAAILCIISMKNMAYYIDLGGVCNFSGNQIWFIIVMTSPILFETAAGILTFVKAFQHAYALWNAASSPLLHSLLRDGIFFCLIIVGLRISNAFIWTWLPEGSMYLGLYLLWAPMSVMSTRFYLNVKDVATVDPFSPTYSISMDQMRKRAISDSTAKSTTFARVSHPLSTMLSSYKPQVITQSSDTQWWREEYDVPESQSRG